MGFIDRQIIHNGKTVVRAVGEKRQDMHGGHGVIQAVAEKPVQGLKWLLTLALDGVRVGNQHDIRFVPVILVGRGRRRIPRQPHGFEQLIREDARIRFRVYHIQHRGELVMQGIAHATDTPRCPALRPREAVA